MRKHAHLDSQLSHSKPRTVRVLAWPGSKNVASNPYSHLLYESLRGQGVEVDEFSVERLMSGKYDICHVHWPETAISRKWILVSIFRALQVIRRLRLRPSRTRLVWTIHNVCPHENFHPKWNEFAMNQLIRGIDGVISFTSKGLALAGEHYPSLNAIPSSVISHGHYQSAYENTIAASEARTFLGLKQDSRVLLFFGQLRPYKNISTLLKSFQELTDPRYHLVIAGKCHPLIDRDELMRAAKTDPRIHLHLQHIEHGDVQYFMNAADMVVLPYSSILHSGAALLALSFARPVLTPNKGGLSELFEQVGTGWVQLYEGELSAQVIEEALKGSERRSRVPNLGAFEWRAIADATLGFYERLLG